MIMAAINAVAQEVIDERVAEKSEVCEIIDCDLNSPGFRCDCGRLLCRNHVYFKLPSKGFRPETICPSCIVDENPELFE